MITFLFTDIEGITRLWESQPARMVEGLERHDQLLRQAIEQHHGEVFKTVGDAFYAAFLDPRQAVDAAVAAQRALHKQLPALRVRMAIHTGEAVARDGDYFGPALNRVARLLSAGHGGQVLLSAATTEAVRGALPDNTELQPLGTHQLRDIAEIETIFQVLPPDLPRRFPPLNTYSVAQRRGWIRAAAHFGTAAALMAVLAGIAVAQAARADRHALAEARERLEAQRRLYVSDMNLAGQALADGNFGRVEKLILQHVPHTTISGEWWVTESSALTSSPAAGGTRRWGTERKCSACWLPWSASCVLRLGNSLRSSRTC